MFNLNRIIPGVAQTRAELNSAANFRPTSLTMGILMLVLTGLLIPGAAYAQVLYGSLTGNVTDQKGAAVPGAKVEVTNTRTGLVKTVNTDERGGYDFSDLQVGNYKVTIALTSFKALREASTSRPIRSFALMLNSK